jgi:hypothetical protein
MWPKDVDDPKLLIQETEDEFIVVVNQDNRVVWITKPEYDDKGNKDPSAWRDFLNSAALVEAIPNDHFGDAIRLNFARLIGEAHVRALEHDYGNARTMLQAAENYITQRNQEISRYWYLSASGLVAMAAAAAAAVLWVFRSCAIGVVGEDALSMFLVAACGGMGALLSIIQRMGESNLDSSAGKHLHFMEGGSRIVAGMLSGVVAVLAIRADILAPALLKDASSYSAMFLVAFVFGFSERLAPSIVGRFATPTE